MKSSLGIHMERVPTYSDRWKKIRGQKGFLVFGVFYEKKGFLRGTGGKEPACQSRKCKRQGFNPWVGTIPWRREWQPTPVFLPGESHGQRNLVGYSPWGRKELDTTEWLNHHGGSSPHPDMFKNTASWRYVVWLGMTIKDHILFPCGHDQHCSTLSWSNACCVKVWGHASFSFSR